MNKERLLKLADHLESGNLNLEFDLGTFYGEGCGCALAECCYIFKEWRFNPYQEPVVHSENREPFGSAAKFFGLQMSEVLAIFSVYRGPGSREVIKDHGLINLGKDAKPQDVAYNIRKLVSSR